MNIKEAGWKIFSLRSEEVSFTIPLFLLYFCSGIYFATGQIFTESLFLQTYGASGLARFFTINGIVLFISGFMYTYLLEILSIKKAYLALISIFNCLPLIALLPKSEVNDPLILFIGNYIATFYLDTHYINYSFQYLSLQNSKRIFPILMAGSKFGAIIITVVISFFSTTFVRYAGIFWLASGILMSLALIVSTKVNPRITIHSTQKANFLSKLSTLVSSKMFIVSAIAVFIMAIVNQNAEYFFAQIATKIYPTQEKLALFLSRYTYITDFITMAMQLFITSRILQKLSIPKANCIYPVSFLSCIAFAIAWPSILTAIALRFFRKNISFVIRQPVTNIMLSIYPRDKVNQARSLINSIANPFGMIAGGLLLSLYATISTETASGIAFAIGILFFAVILKQNQLYKEAIFFKFQQNTKTIPINTDDLVNTIHQPLITNKGEYIDALAQYGLSVETLPIIEQYYDQLNQTTKLKIVSLLYDTIGFKATSLAKKAINDSDALVRAHAYRYISLLPVSLRKEILDDCAKLFSVESLIHTLLLHPNDETQFKQIPDILTTFENQIYSNGTTAHIEFILLCSVLPVDLYINSLYRCAVKTKNEIIFKFCIQIADKFTQQQAFRLLIRFKHVNLYDLSQFIAAINIHPHLKYTLLDYRFDLTQNILAAWFTKESDSSVIANRLIQKRSYYKKTNYLNLFLALSILPEETLPLYINASIARLNQLYQCVLTIDTLPLTNEMKRFCKYIFQDTISYEKHLLIKALSIANGVHADIAYEANILLKDSDLENYIIEFLSLSQKGSQLSLLEPYTTPKNKPASLPVFIKSCKYIKSFTPSLLKYLDFFEKLLDNKNTKTPEEQVIGTIPILISLKENTLFKDTPIDQLVHLLTIINIHNLPENTVFIKENEMGDELFIIVDGEVSVTKKGKEIALLKKGSCIGELSIIDREPRSATVKTTQKTTLLSIKRNDFLMTLKENPTIAINIMKVIADRLRTLISQ